MENQAELAAQLTALKEQADKARAEIVDRIDELEQALDDDEVSDEVLAAFAALKQSVQGIDDIVPDAEPKPDDPGAPA